MMLPVLTYPHPLLLLAAATDNLQRLPAQLGSIFYFVVLPMLLLAGIGFVIQRKLGLDPATLTRLNFYFVIPATVYYSVVTSTLQLGTVAVQILFTVCVMAVLAALAVLIAKARRVPPDQVNAMIATAIFYNSGNYGLPMQELAFRPYGRSEAAMALQIVIMLTQNVSNFTLGVILAAAGKRDRHWAAHLKQITKLAPLYALAAALITVEVRSHLSPRHSQQIADALFPFWYVITLVRNAFVPVALATLGAQLALVRPGSLRYPVKTSVFLRLVMGPVVGFFLAWLFGFTGFFAQVLIISTTTPTAVNAMLICMEFDNHPTYLAQAVFYSTVLSPLTVALTIFLAQSNLVPFLAM